MKKKNSFFVKKNKCPYCLYPCDSAFLDPNDPHKKGGDVPEPGDVSFCLMCCSSMTWDKNMKLQKFDLNSIEDMVERVRIKMVGHRVHEFWDKNPDKSGRREKYLKIMDKRNSYQ